MVIFVTISSGTLGVACFAFMTLTDRWSVRETLFWIGFGLVFVSASFAALTENQKRRRSDRLGGFIGRALGLARDCDNPAVDFNQTKTRCDDLEKDENEYVRAQFGPGAVHHLNNSNGVTIAPASSPTDDRFKLSNWCRARAARLSELIAGLHVG